jgi:hypothetical protein
MSPDAGVARGGDAGHADYRWDRGGNDRTAIQKEADVSPTDIVWVLPLLAGVALALLLRSTVLALLLGFLVVVTSFILWGYSIDHYSNNDCQPGEPCPTGEQVIDVLGPVFFLGGSALVLVSLGRTVWNYVSALRAWRRGHA